MKPETEQTIEKALQLLDSIEGAQAPEGFSQKVFARLDAKQSKTARVIPMRTVWATAAAIALLLMLNVWIGAGYNQQNKMANNPEQQVAGEMGLSPQGFWY
jgi:type VI protein secretion system component VasF